MRWCLVLALVFIPFLTSAEEFTVEQNCRLLYERSGFCPPDVCDLRCKKGLAAAEDCRFTCVSRPCEQISAAYCPLETCQLILGCTGEPVCYFKEEKEAPLCGELAYIGNDVACCEGMVKKCGVEFFDGTCDMIGKNSIYSVPICVPCGNGICNQFENACNCPEDCKREKKILPLILDEE